MKISKIVCPDGTWIVEILTNDENPNQKRVYFLDKEGLIIDFVEVEDVSIGELRVLIKHMFVISTSPRKIWEMQCATMFNRIFEPDMIPFDYAFSFAINDELLVNVIREFCKVEWVLDYTNTIEYNECYSKTMDAFVYNRPTPIEKENESIHLQGIESRKKMLNIIKQWVL
ncbi:hypothetical protein [Methanobrevibacter sp.]|uniref:hypothetical protein n=1 Tax=Methanobrevibacter sp. TaxID=66852 RepID=UPI00386CA9E1